MQTEQIIGKTRTQILLQKPLFQPRGLQQFIAVYRQPNTSFEEFQKYIQEEVIVQNGEFFAVKFEDESIEKATKHMSPNPQSEISKKYLSGLLFVEKI
jgi:hypothetical protein